jgi:hypothetical protein
VSLKEVTIQELAKWVESNPQIRWSPENFGPNEHNKPGHLRGKYIRFNLDTRDMKVFRCSLEGAGDEIVADFRDNGEGTILDELDRRLRRD